jgi:HEAT repeat protein
MPGKSLTYFCFECYAENERPEGACVRCGGAIEPPPDTSYADLLIWALHHPLAPVATHAAAVLGDVGDRRAIGPLHVLIDDPPDPYIAAAALASLVALQGVDELRPLLERLAREAAPPVRRVAKNSLQE